MWKRIHTHNFNCQHKIIFRNNWICRGEIRRKLKIAYNCFIKNIHMCNQLQNYISWINSKNSYQEKNKNLEKKKGLCWFEEIKQKQCKKNNNGMFKNTWKWRICYVLCHWTKVSVMEQTDMLKNDKTMWFVWKWYQWRNSIYQKESALNQKIY